jgi:hypothetical protein
MLAKHNSLISFRASAKTRLLVRGDIRRAQILPHITDAAPLLQRSLVHEARGCRFGP